MPEPITSSQAAVRELPNVVYQGNFITTPEIPFIFKFPVQCIRETKVLELLGRRFNNTPIAKRLFIGESTVRKYVGSLLDKLQHRNGN